VSSKAGARDACPWSGAVGAYRDPGRHARPGRGAAGPAARAQLPAADEAFRKGDYAAARAGYERVLTTDSLNARALYRLAILDSWDGKLARSLARFGWLRRLDP